MKIGRYEFEGPYSTVDKLEDKAGIYVILVFRNNTYYVIDVGESATVKSRVANHDRSLEWKKQGPGDLFVVVLYTTNIQQTGRIQIEQELRKMYSPPCGVR